MSKSISARSVVSSGTQVRVGFKPNFLLQQQHQDRSSKVSNKPKTMYFKKLSAFKNRNDIQKQINSRIEDQKWVKNLSLAKEIYLIFGFYFNQNMLMHSKKIIEKHGEIVDRF